MTPAQTFVTTPRGKQRRFFAYFLSAGGAGLILVLALQLLGLSLPDIQPVIAYPLFGSFLLLGAFGCLIDRMVTLDPERRQLSETLRFLPFVVRRRRWSFDALECVVERSGAYPDSDVHWRWVGVRTVSGSLVWLRCFLTRSPEPSDEVQAFRADLIHLTGLRHDYELDWRKHTTHEIPVA